MDFRIDKNDLISGLHLTHAIADRKATIPILANVLIRTQGRDRVVFAATDLKTIMTVVVPAHVEEEGGLTVSAKQIYEIARGLPGKDAQLRSTEQNWLDLRCGKSEFKVVGMNERDYPKLPVSDGLSVHSVSSKELWSMISKTIFSVSQDDTRPHLASVLFESGKEKATMVSTDGHRLSKATCVLPGLPKLEPGILIPRKGLGEIRKALEGRENPCELGVDQGYLVIKADYLSLWVKLGDGQFPPYEQVIPKDNDKKVVLDRELLLEAIKRVSIIASEKTWGVKFALVTGTLSIEVENPDLGNAKETIEVDYRGADLQIGFNARYFIDVLSEMKNKEVVLEMGGDLDPGVIRPPESDDFVGVIMPMRL
jgi:DNA polymerase-3 subunit beta